MPESEPTLLVDDLRTWFFTKAGIVKAVDGVSFSVEAGKVLGLVGESGSGKTVTGFSILGLVDPPGRIAGGRILFKGRDLVGLDEDEMRKLRGSRIAMIFQDPMMTLNPVLRIETQMIEAVQGLRQLDNATTWLASHYDQALSPVALTAAFMADRYHTLAEVKRAVGALRQVRTVATAAATVS